MQGHDRDLLFFATERYKFCVLQWDAKGEGNNLLHPPDMWQAVSVTNADFGGVLSGNLQTKASGNLADPTGRPVEHGQIGIIDPDCRVIGVQMYDGLLKVQAPSCKHVSLIDRVISNVGCI